jgi:hypothetical protein
MNWQHFLSVVAGCCIFVGIFIAINISTNDDAGEFTSRYVRVSMIVLFIIAILSGALAAGLS